MKIRPSNTQTRQAAAFTLIEIVITLTIIAILASGSIYLLKGQIDSAKDTRVDSDLQAIGLALQSYESRALRMPTTEQGLHALVEKPTIEPIPENYRAFMEEMPKDPWGQEYKYRFPAQKSKKPYDVWTVGADGQDGTEDDIGNWKKTAAK
ncbi:type II secretion system major pseudopilin GspG [Prosthecobacter sp.]|uniref:type II secretion system major pseudopilin GspG n=1 Tax=Prosthecobacter sp. TaxID=1965333 RepID=UPI001DD50999|nr:type II secretion system major pseudopilin GspG [Prosthecobacter sp.]MCB1276091.1 type II secretion system major pseudopilin GspG [Prosthecobacter sp.]